MTKMFHRRGVVAIAGPSSRSAAEIAAEFSREFGSFRAATNDQLVKIDADLDRLSLHLGRLTVGGGYSPPGTDPQPVAAAAQRFWSHVRPNQPFNAASDVEAFTRYRAALNQYLRRGPDGLTADFRNDLSVGSDRDGGFLAPIETSPRMIEKKFRSSPLRTVASVEPINAGEVEFPIDTTDFAVGWTSEKGTRSDTDRDSGALGMHTIVAHEHYAMPSLTNRLIETAAVDLVAWLGRKISSKLARNEGASFISGNGVGKPFGILTPTAVATADATRAWDQVEYIPTGAAGAFPLVSGLTSAIDDGALRKVVMSLNSEYRVNARWLMNSMTALYLMNLRDAYGRPLWRDSLEAGVPSTLLGYPVVIAEDMPDVAADALAIAFGDWEAAYTIVDSGMMRLIRDPYTDKGRTKFFVYARVGGDAVNRQAYKLLKFSAS